MKTSFFRTGAALAVAAASLSLVSCITDPYYGPGPGPGYGYNSGYYGGSYYGGGSTTVFVSTGDPNWGYDPVRYCYYDYRRRCYYDPYLYGYYPSGYRPPFVYGVPHPYGWRGHGFIAPPRNIHYGTIPNYRNRADLLRGSNFNWSRNVGAGRPSTFNQTPGRGNQFPTNPRYQGTQPGYNRPGTPQTFTGHLQPGQPQYRQPYGSQPSYRPTYNIGQTYGNQLRPQYSSQPTTPRYQPSYGNPGRPTFQSPGGNYQPQYRPSSGGGQPQFRQGGGGGAGQPQYHQNSGGGGGTTVRTQPSTSAAQGGRGGRDFR